MSHIMSRFINIHMNMSNIKKKSDNMKQKEYKELDRASDADTPMPLPLAH